ncbi:MAG: GNAT family N-acetyltransferase [Ilumatobacteraceae bacterium]|nr:GNAT family N-acetyltransferase [Ilumatobacteraceae bacterium]
MTPAPTQRDGTYSIVELSVREAQCELQQLLARCEKADRRPPLGDHALSVRTTTKPAGGAFAVVDPSSHLVAYIQATPTSETSPTWTIDLAIDPNHRHDHDPITDITLSAVLVWLRTRDGCDVQWWKNQPTDSDRTIAELHGLLPKRQLLSLGRALTQAGLASLPQRGIEHVMLFVDGANTTARNLYQQLGFTVTAPTAAFQSSLPKS